MKTLLVMLMALSVSIGASAQRKGGHFYAARPRVIIVPSISYGFGYGYGHPYFGGPYGYPYGMYPRYNTNRIPYKLSLEIQSIRSDYKSQIRAVRKDKSLSHSARRQQIVSLKADRDRQILDAERNFNTRAIRNRPNRNGNSDNQSPSNDDSFQYNGK